MTYVADFTEFGTEEDFSGGFRVMPEGQYHFRVTGVKDVTNSESDVTGVEVELESLAGTNADGIGQTLRERFIFPLPTAKDGGKFQRQRLAKLLTASGVATKQALLGFRGEIEWHWLAGRQFVGSVSHRGYNGKTFAQLDGMNFWHLADRDGEHIPRANAEADRYLSSGGAAPVIGSPDNDFSGV